ncbi:MAG: hypothetical protein ABI605_03430 [Rhizobacter sp.]
MKNKSTYQVILATILLLTSFALAMLVGERSIAVVINYWKFGRAAPGIDFGANSSFLFLGLCVLGVSASSYLYQIASGDELIRYRKIPVIAGLIFLISAMDMLLLVMSGAAFLYCGR